MPGRKKKKSRRNASRGTGTKSRSKVKTTASAENEDPNLNLKTTSRSSPRSGRKRTRSRSNDEEKLNSRKGKESVDIKNATSSCSSGSDVEKERNNMASDGRPSRLKDTSVSSLTTSNPSESESDSDETVENMHVKFKPFTNASTNTNELISRLKRIHLTLTLAEQRDESSTKVNSYLDLLSAELIKPSILKNRNKIVRRIAGCCIADIIRIYAPDAPYDNTELKTIFAFFVQQLRGLSEKQRSLRGGNNQQDNCNVSYSMYILEKLAVCKSSCILLDLEDESYDEHTGEDLIFLLFETLLDSVHQSSDMEQAVELLSSLIEEMETDANISSNILDLMLVHLLPDKQKENPTGFQVSSRIIKRCWDRVREPFSVLINHVLSTDNQRHLTEEEVNQLEIFSESSNINDLIFELHKIDPALLLYILPHVSDQLKVDDINVRTKAVDLLGNIFCRSSSEYIMKNERVWVSFLQRVHDVDASIRLSMVRFAGFVMENSDSDLSKCLSPYFTIKDVATSDLHLINTKTKQYKSFTFLNVAMEDKAYEVRKEACEVCRDFIQQEGSFDCFNEALLRTLADRMSDKKTDIATIAMEGLGSAFEVHLVNKVWMNPSLEVAEGQSVEKLLSWIPDRILSGVFLNRTPAERIRFSWLQVRLLDEIILGQKAFSALFMHQRLRIQELTNSFLKHRTDKNTNSAMKDLEKLAGQFIPSSTLKGNSSVVDRLKEIYEKKDNHIFRDIKTLADAGTSKVGIKKAFADLIRRVGSKSDLSKLLRVLVHRMSMKTISSSEIMYLADFLAYQYTKGIDEEALSDLDCDDETTAIIKHYLETEQEEASFSCSNGKFSDKLKSLCIFVTQILTTFPRLLSSETDEIIATTKWQLKLIKENIKNHSSDEGEGMSDDDVVHLCTMACDLIKFGGTTWSVDSEIESIDLGTCKSLLEHICTTSSLPLCVKPCLVALSKTVDSNDAVFSRIYKSYISKGKMKYSNPNLLCCMYGLGSMLKHNSNFITSLLISADGQDSNSIMRAHVHAIHFAFELVKVPYAHIEKALELKSNKESETYMCKLKRSGIKIITYEIIRRLKQNKMDGLKGTLSYLSTSKRVTIQKMVLLLRRIVQDRGNPWGREEERKELNQSKQQVKMGTWPPECEEQFALLRLDAAIAILRLTDFCDRNPTDESIGILKEGSPKSPDSYMLREIQRWIELSYIALDPDVSIREKFVAKVNKYFLKRGRHHLKFGSFLVLASGISDGRKNTKSYQTLLRLLRFSANRCEAEIRKGRTDSYSMHAPESMLPYIIYLLAHHPSIPRNLDLAQKFIMSANNQKVFERPLTLFLQMLNTVAKTVLSKESNAGLLYTLLDRMQITADKFDPACQNIHMLGEFSRLLIKIRLKVSPESLAYPGNVRLPAMYVNADQCKNTIGHSPFFKKSAGDDIDDSISLPPISPITSLGGKRKSLAPAKIRTPTWKESISSYLPDGFELKIGRSEINPGSAHKRGRGRKRNVGERNGRSKSPRPRSKSRSPRSLSKGGGKRRKTRTPSRSPTRIQPSRARKKNAVYTEVDSDADEIV